MRDCDKYIKEFHNSHVKLLESQKKNMRERRDANRSRLEKGLEKLEIEFLKFVPQGSYAMHTMIQDDENDYDIDDGIVFDRECLVGEKGGEYTSRKCRELVYDVICADKSAGFSKPPEILKNCVRVYYNDGAHVDIPSYRQNEDGSYEIASSEWETSDPEAVTEWYNSAVMDKSPELTGSRQMRRITLLLKKFSKSRGSWKTKMPSGFVISTLVDECFVSDDRDDVSLYETMSSISIRLNLNKTVYNPINITQTISSSSDTQFFFEKLSSFISELDCLFDSSCVEETALKAWNKVFKQDYFLDKIAEAQEKSKTADLVKTGNFSQALGSIVGATSSSALGATVIKNTRAYGED